MSNAKVEVLLDGVTKLGEAPHWSEKTQELYFVDIKEQNVHRYNPKTKEHHQVHVEGGPVSLVIPVKTQPGTFIISRGRELSVMKWNGHDDTALDCDQVKKIVTVQKDFSDNRFNDGKCDASGRLWAGTMGKHIGAMEFELERGAMYSWQTNQKIRKHFDKVGISNGLCWNHDNTIMYYVDSLRFSVDAFDFDLELGNIDNRRTIYDFKANDEVGFPDGMTIDNNGNLWVAVYGGSKILQIDPTLNEVIERIEMPAKYITSVMFGGPFLDVLYATSAKKEESSVDDQKPGSLFRITGTGCRGLPAVEFTGKF